MGLSTLEEKTQKARKASNKTLTDEQAKIKADAEAKKIADAEAKKKAEEAAALQAKLDAKLNKNTDIKKATRTKISYDEKGLVTKGEVATTDDIEETDTKKFSSGINTGDETQGTIIAKIGYTPEDVANKENVTIDTSTIKYPTVNLLKTGLDGKIGTTLADAKIFVGNASNVATAVAVSGDISITNAGVVTVSKINGIAYNADPLVQYALLSGRSGGQTLIGGTALGDDLALSSTSHATKGNIFFGNSTYDEANQRLGINTTNPTVPLDIPNFSSADNLAEFGSFGIQSIAINNGFMSNNEYYDGSPRYRSNGFISMFQFYNGEIWFRSAPSGLANNVATLTTGMKYLNNGNVQCLKNLLIVANQSLILGDATTSTYPLLVESAANNQALIRTTDATKQSAFFLSNDRASLGAYGGNFVGGSNSGALGNLFGVPRSDRYFVVSNGVNSLGMCAGTLTAQPFILGTNNTERARFLSTGEFGFGVAAPTATLHLAAGTASLVPFKLNSGTLKTTLVAGDEGGVEFDGTDFYLTI